LWVRSACATKGWARGKPKAIEDLGDRRLLDDRRDEPKCSAPRAFESPYVLDPVAPSPCGSLRLAALVLALDPGYADDSVARHGVLDADIELVQKPIMPRMLARQVRAVLDS
jgi:hypothetical protein